MPVLIHLTYWAPGCADLESRDPRLWNEFDSMTAEEAVLWIIKRLERSSAAALIVTDEHLGTVFYARHPESEKPVRMATVLTGLSFLDLADALNTLKRKKAA